MAEECGCQTPGKESFLKKFKNIEQYVTREELTQIIRADGTVVTPTYRGVHDGTKTYVSMDMVEDVRRVVFVAKKLVPIGTPLFDASYWIPLNVIDSFLIIASSYGVLPTNTASENGVKIKSMLGDAKNKIVIFDKEGTYSTDEQMVLAEGTSIDLTGSTINFNISGWKNAIEMNNNTSLSGGRVNLHWIQDAQGAPHGGYGCVITMGKYDSDNGVETYGVKNVSINNMEVDGDRRYGNMILMTGDTHNVLLNNISFPDNNQAGRPIIAHWGGYRDGATPTKTLHVHNVKISNIKMGKMFQSTSSTAITSAAIFLSATYNIEISNVFIEETDYYAGLLRVMCYPYFRQVPRKITQPFDILTS